MSRVNETSSSHGADKRFGLIAKLAAFIGQGNPLLEREVLTTMRLRSIKGVLIALPLIITAVVLIIAAESSYAIGRAAEQGEMILSAAVTTALYVVGLIGAVLGAQTIANERHAKTLDLVLATGMSPGKIIAGKATAVWVVLALLILACVPPLGICFVLGGVSFTQLLMAIGIPLAVATIPVALGLALGAGQGSSRVSVGAAAAIVGVFGPMLFSTAWLGVLFVIGVDRFDHQGPFLLPTPGEGFWSFLIGAVLLPAYMVIAPTWLFLASAVGSLSSEATDRSIPFRKWFLFVGPAGGLLIGAIGLLKGANRAEPVVLLISLFGAILTIGILALTAHPFPRRTKSTKLPKPWHMTGPSGNATFAVLVSAVSLLIPMIVLTGIGGLAAIWAATVVFAFVVFLSGAGVLLATITKPRTARLGLFGVGIFVTVLPLIFWAVAELATVGSSSHAEIWGLLSPIGALANVAANHSVSAGIDPTPAATIVAYLLLGSTLWTLGAARLKKTRSAE